MTTIERSIAIDAPSAAVWSALADFGGISAWNPNVKTSRLTSAGDVGVGITRECQLTPMGTVQERVTEWVAGESMTIEIYEFKNVPGMRQGVAKLRVEPLGGQSVVHMHMRYSVGLGPIGAGMNAAVMKRQFGSSIAKLLAGLKVHVETGEPIVKSTNLPTKSVQVVGA